MTTNKKYDVFGVGNAMVDILAHVDDEFIQALELNRGSMTLMDSDQQAAVLQKLEKHPLSLASGGSAANTMVAVAQSGGTGIYSGKVAHDTHGEFYRRDMQSAGISFDVPMAQEASLPTGTCVVLTTPDAERTMCTHLGISTSLAQSDINLEHLAQSKIAYIEGYLWDATAPRQSCMKTFEEAKKLGVQTAFTFSDSFLIDRFAKDFESLVNDYCDIIFCNAIEARQFCEAEEIEVCAQKIGSLVDLAFITNSADGCYVCQNGVISHVAGFPVKPIDTVGAGDAFAGGVLYGLTNGMSPAKAARWGNYFASRVVETNGPRLDISMKEHLASIIG
ncbi:MAG: adenosine kinase [Pirellulaceae bacterium]